MMGTDTVALACILGGAAIAGGVTMAVGEGGQRVDVGCSTVSLATAPRVVVSVRGEDASVVVAPSVEVISDCAGIAGIEPHHAEQVRRSVERARRQVDRARTRVERVERSRARDAQVRLQERAVRLQEVESELEGLEEFLQRELGERLELEMEYLQERLEPLEETEIELEGLEERLELELEGLDEVLELELRTRLDAEMDDLLERLERMGGEVRG